MRRTVCARILGVVALVALTVSANLLARQDKPAATGKLRVTVEYTGKGAVDKDHHLWLWVFDNPDSSTWPDTEPVARGTLSENSAVYSFAELPKQVYLAAGYDEKGGYTGEGVPPQGTPVAVYGGDPSGSAAPVTTGGDDAALKFTFDDSYRLP